MEWYSSEEIWKITNGQALRGYKAVKVKKNLSQKRIQNMLSDLKKKKPGSIFKIKRDSKDKRKILYNQEFLITILQATDNRNTIQKQKAINAINEQILTPAKMREIAHNYVSKTMFRDNIQQLNTFAEQLYTRQLQLKHAIISAIEDYEATFKEQKENIKHLAKKEDLIYYILHHTKYDNETKLELINLTLSNSSEVIEELLKYQFNLQQLKEIESDLNKL